MGWLKYLLGFGLNSLDEVLKNTIYDVIKKMTLYIVFFNTFL